VGEDAAPRQAQGRREGRQRSRRQRQRQVREEACRAGEEARQVRRGERLKAHDGVLRLYGTRAAERYTDEDLAVLAAQPIEQLTLSRQRITRLPPLQPGLRTLSVGDCDDLASLDGIEHHPTLQKLWLGALPRLDLARVFALCAELPELTELRFVGAVPVLPRTIGKLPSLISVELEGTHTLDFVESFAALGASATLRTLRIHDVARLPDAVAPLTRLETLELRRVHGTMPSVGAMRALVKLDVGDCKFNAVSSTIGQLASLETLLLTRNPIAVLPDELCACTNLRVLDLDDTQVKTLPAQIGRLVNLRELRLRSKRLRTLPESIGELAELRTLTLPWDKVTVPESLYRLRLESFSGPVAIDKQLVKRPPPTPQVDRLHLHEADRLPADFGDPLVLSLRIHAYAGTLPQLDACRRLQEITLETGDFADAFTRLGRRANLRSVSIETDRSTLPDELGALSQISRLELECPKLARLPAAIGRLVGLEALVIKPHAMTTLPDQIGALVGLRLLALDATNLTLPETFGALVRLESLALAVGERARLPASIVNCTALATVSIDARFDAPCLDDLAILARLPALRILSLRNVGGAAAVVEALAGTQIEELALHCKLETLPPALGRLAKLRRLKLEDTRLDALPPALRDCSELRWISIPYKIAHDTGLKSQLPKGRWRKHSRSGVTWYERSD
jgi:Leucine-rich repeat (LRR) protein